MQLVLHGEGPFGHLEPTGLLTNHTDNFDSHHLCWRDAWDTQEACFRICFLPALALLPLVLAVALVTLQTIQFSTTWRPSWTKPFVIETKQSTIQDELAVVRRRTPHLVLLIVLASTCFILSTVPVIVKSLGTFQWSHHGTWNIMQAMAPVITWFLVLSFLLVVRPRTPPLSILAVLTAQGLYMGARLGSHALLTTADLSITGSLLGLDILTILVILDMPFRDPAFSSKEISRPFTEPTCTLRSPEDNLNLWQWWTVAWMTPLISVGSKRQLNDEDVWELAYEFQHRRLHDNFRKLKGSVMRRLLKANAIDIIILVALEIVQLIFVFSQPLLLQALLDAMSNSAAYPQAPLTYAGLALVFRAVNAQLEGVSLWFGRRCYERSRGEMITMLYEKTLNRKVGFSDNPLKQDDDKTDTAEVPINDNAPSKSTRPLWQRATGVLSRFFERPQRPAPSKTPPASMGKILNLMRNDVYEVAQRFWEVQKLVQVPISTILAIILFLRLLGPSSLVAVAVIALTQGAVVLLAKGLVYYERKRRAATDVKLQQISQFVEAIRHLRWYGWQAAWLEKIMDARQKELNLRIVTALWSLTVSFFNTLTTDLTPAVAFLAYTYVAGNRLSTDIIFPAMVVCRMLTFALRDIPGLIIVWLNAMVAVDRIENFMSEPDRNEMSTEALIGDSLALDNGSFAWPGSSKPVIRNITLSFPQGLNVICGEVASGKTALLQALLGELDILGGQLFRPKEAIGYCAQTPWLQSMSIRENILFSAPYEDKRYEDVLDACELLQDLAGFKAGDLTLIGENGIGLSGGQRARVALARAVYSRANILLLDDPLSALDQQTAESIVKRCFAGSLIKGRTVVLVTHRVDLILGVACQVIQLKDGSAEVLDQDAAAMESLARITSQKSNVDETAEQRLQDHTKAAVPDNFVEEEHRAQGGVQARVYWEYVKAAKLRWWAVLLVVFVTWRFCAVMESWVAKSWGEAYGEESSSSRSLLWSMTGEFTYAGLKNPLDKLPSPDVNVKPWLLVFFVVSLMQPALGIAQNAILIIINYTAGRELFKDIMSKVAHAGFRFYDITPVGRLMNRMTSDIGVIDGNISEQLRQVAWYGVSWISSIIVIASVTPTFLVFSLALTALFVVIFLRFLPTSQSLRRLEMVSLSPLMSNFGALLNGLTTVRAFGAQSRFQDRVIEVVDTFQKMDHFYWTLQNWLMLRYDLLAATSTFLLTILALITDVSAGLMGFILFAADKYVSSTHALCKQYGQLQMEFVSVERVVELQHIEQEPEGTFNPPASWPRYSGDIVFSGVTIRYAPHLDPALQDISLTIKGGSKTAIIGRTGSGKSTLALSILATILPQKGNITVDNVDLVAVDKQVLRTRITFLAQDPVLFPGNLRQNLDPVEEHTDEACIAVLDRVCGRQGWSLNTKIEAHGHNLSQGQRQLVGLARAVLRRSAIIILDEATASIDKETSMQIQQVIHEEMKESTVITIAHRLEAVKNADYCVVLGSGRILEQGPADVMLREHKEDMIEDDND